MKQAHISTVSIPIERLIPHPKNYNTHNDRQISKLRHLIRVHGYAKGSVVYQLSTHYLLAGHGVIEALKQEGYTHVDAVELDVDDSKAEAFMIADNKIATDSVIDNMALNNLISELSAMDVPSLDFAYDSSDLEDLASRILADSGGYIAEPQDDEIPDVVEPITQTGDLWTLGKHRVLCGDSTKAEDVARLMDGVKADMVFTDPPYGMNKDFENDNLKDMRAFHSKWMVNISDIKFSLVWYDPKRMSDVIVIGEQYLGKMVDYLHLYKPNDVAFPLHSWIRKSESMIIFGNPDYKEVKLYAHDTYLWNHTSKDKSIYHPSVKAMEVVVDVLSRFNANIILDLFLGSGTSTIACQKLNRVCYGMEIDQHYCDVIVKRYIDFVGSSEGVFCDRDGVKTGYQELINERDKQA